MSMRSIKSVHPFPARMAPELALNTLKDLPAGSTVLDPMSGSGTVVRQATNLGHRAIGYDMDPLAVLMSRVWTTPVDDRIVLEVSDQILQAAKQTATRDRYLPWIDDDSETAEFVDYWFGKRQQRALRSIAGALFDFQSRKFAKAKHAAADVFRVALSRIVVTKEQGASLARDTSHSRPHKVAEHSDYDVWDGLEKSLKQVRKRLEETPPSSGASVSLGDARLLTSLENGTIDAVLTSPPYLNAIDYMRGHRMSLVWLGHRMSELRSIRSSTIGAERAPDRSGATHTFEEIRDAMCDVEALPSRYGAMIDRYCEDLYRMVSEISRVMKSGGRATFVVGNSCLKGVFVRNADGLAKAARMCGMSAIETYERELPMQSRYLPMTASGALGKRMRTESILVYSRN